MRSPVNPVLSRELVERMRGTRAMVMLTAYLVVLGVIVVLVYQAKTDPQGDPFGAPIVTRVAAIGQGLFEWVLFFILLLVLFLVPGFTAGAIAGERDRQTLLPLQVTLLRPISILLGKVGASLAFTVLLVVASLPLLAVAYLIGGVTVGDVLKGTGMVLFVAVALACITVACSTFAKRVQTATILAYGIVLLLTGGTIAAFLVARQIDESRGFDTVDPPEAIIMANPVAALANLSGNSPYATFTQFDPFGRPQVDSDAPLTGLRDLFSPDVFGGDVVFQEGVAFEGGFADAPAVEAVQFDAFGNPVPQAAITDSGMPLWGWSMVILGSLSVVCLAGSARRLRTPAATER
jgi:ABC-type transport system involved in multi-copper enzyme maturation permease subunit